MVEICVYPQQSCKHRFGTFLKIAKYSAPTSRTCSRARCDLSIYEKHNLWDLTVTVAASASETLLKYYTVLVSLIKNAPQAIVF